MSIGRRQRILELPHAGRPEGRCPECGPHGNAGWVDLSVWRRHVVPCLECSARADRVAWAMANELEPATVAEVRAEGCEPAHMADCSADIEPLGDHPWGRRVTVVVPYRHAQANNVAPILGVP